MSWTMMRRMILCLACAVLARAAAAAPFVCVRGDLFKSLRGRRPDSSDVRAPYQGLCAPYR